MVENPMQTYHVPPKISLFVLLETLQVLHYARTGILDVFLRDLQRLLKLWNKVSILGL